MSFVEFNPREFSRPIFYTATKSLSSLIQRQTNAFILEHESPIMQKYDAGNNCESLKASESKEILFFLRLPYCGNISLKLKKKFGNI